jgi:tetratricopeptide (TPR) repeat protein
MGAALLVTLLIGLFPAAARSEDLLAEAARSDTALEERVHNALLWALLDSPRVAVGDMEALDRSREALGQPATGLTDDFQLLSAGLAPTRDARRFYLGELLDSHPDPVVEKLARHALDADDDAAAADQLLLDDVHNRRANVINGAIRPLGVFSGAVLLAAINPFLIAGSAVDSVATTAMNLWNYNRLSPREREALVRYRTMIAQDGRTSDAPEIVHQVQALGVKRAAALCDDTIDSSKEALSAENLEAARFYLTSAQRLPGCADRVKKPQEKLAQALAKHAAADEAMAWPADQPILPPGSLEALDYESLARATVVGEPDAMMAAAQRFARSHSDSALSPSAKLVVSAARDLGGHRAEARTALQDLSGDGSHAGEVAKGILESPEFGQLDALHAAERHHTRQVAQYVLLGGFNSRNALYTAAQFGAQGAQAAQSFGVFNVIGMATRAWQAWRHDPVPNQEIIDRGEEILARDPDSPDAPEVHEKLADAYGRAGNYERALMHYRATPNADPKQVAKLEGKLADHLLEESQHSPAQGLMLAAIAHDFPGTGAAEKAQKKLKDDPPPEGLKLDRDLLRANPTVLGPSALDLDPVLLDGDPHNGEIADRGVTVANGELQLSLRSDGPTGERVEKRKLSPEAYARARAAAEEVLYTSLLTKDDRAPETGRFERYIPVYIAGSIGENGNVSVAPGIKTRPYTSEDKDLYE